MTVGACCSVVNYAVSLPPAKKMAKFMRKTWRVLRQADYPWGRPTDMALSPKTKSFLAILFVLLALALGSLYHKGR